ncbi:hypothetical protein [Enterococcus malodoratus]|uniref:Uncharacterized protein n=1 Tax=Enterococcus malodoratus ATCC 43197 TaxID=1158601 RepID=R2RYW4_9ENTE|nr:hypothetical protein [Enterococcus malodoratus]EOH81099.1 hypothetical protein UAI_01144 [Enterococcus malodoratus ATCC 43197]EOT69609.1 hypothetical protein I585_01076 [Enterococcus malodoratus ATCC 43197]SPX01250.1 Uncharacterised protein [Enterococcus malodoratus]STC71037.1 Uncharacterised protein [Enterococcus malodoratus]
MLKKLDLFLREKPLFILMLLIGFTLSIKLIANSLNHSPIFANFFPTIFLCTAYLAGYFAARFKNERVLIFVLYSLSALLYLVVDGFITNSLVNYTSFILLAIVALLYTGLSILAAEFLFKGANYGSTKT